MFSMVAGRTVVCLLTAFAAIVQATRTGDEDFGAETAGTYYAFADRTVHVITPVNLNVVKNLTTDQDGNPLSNAGASGGSNGTSRTWNDAAFIEDAENSLRYVAVNEGDVYTGNNASAQYSYVSVIDASTQKFVARLRVGARPVHLYVINQTKTLWSHSDAEGVFYLIPVNNSQNISVSTKVPAFVDNPAHGKLVINDALFPVGYGTNVAEQIIPKFNLSSATRTASLTYNSSLPDPSVCTGTHTIVYSRVNRHLLIECVDGAGVLEWNTANDSFVALHSTLPGVVTGSPADDIIFVGNKEGSNATLLKPGANGMPSTVYATLQVDSNPDYPVFYSNSSSEEPTNFTDYTIFFPLTRNTNLNNIRAAGNNVTTLSYLESPSDCQYMNSSTVMASSVGSSSSSSMGLMLATASNGSALTPSCGACAAGFNSSDPTQFAANLSGFGVLDLSTFKSGAKNTSTMLLSAGATLPQRNLETGANQCSFATEAAYRTAKRGGAYVATVADLPQPSIYVVDASSPSDPIYGVVRTAKSPSKLAWVPANVD